MWKELTYAMGREIVTFWSRGFVSIASMITPRTDDAIENRSSIPLTGKREVVV